MKRKFLISLKLLTTWFVLNFLGVANAATVRVTGNVTNGTRNAGAAGATVQLLRPVGGEKPWELVATTKANAQGRFDFGPRNLPADDILIARAAWQGYSYDGPAYDGAGRLKQFDPDLTVDPTQVSLQVFDSTTEAPPLTATVHHVAIESQERDLKCTERLVLENDTLRTFIGTGPERVTVKLSLPKEARDVALDPDMRDAKLVRKGDEVEISKPITPKAYNSRNAIILSYVMSWPASLPWNRYIDLSRSVHYPTKFFFVARTESDRKLMVNAPGLGREKDEALPIEGGMQTRIVNSIGSPMSEQAALESGTQVAITISRAINPLVWAFVLFVVALCIMVPAALIRGKDKPRGEAGAKISPVHPENARGKISEPTEKQSVNGGTPAYSDGQRGSSGAFINGQMPQSARDLIEQIAHLDDEWEAGKIGADEYQKQRAAWKDRLVELMSARK